MGKRKFESLSGDGDHSEHEGSLLKRARTFRPVDAAVLLDRIIAYLADDEERGYKAFVRRTGAVKIRDVLVEGVRAPMKRMMETRAYWDKAALYAIEGDTKSRNAGIYLDIVADSVLEAFLRLYIGQSDNLKLRIREHWSKMHLRKSLHHFAATQPNAVPTFVVLFEIDRSDSLDLWLNIAEQWFACLFQTLPRVTLEIFLEPDEIRSSELGLNVASPLNQNHGQKAKEESAKMKNSTDPVVQKYWQEVIVPQNRANLQKGREANAANQYRGVIEAKRASSSKKDLKREAVTDAERNVIVRCGEYDSAESEKLDAAPQYEISSGKYIVRGQRCPTCPKKKDGKSVQTFFDPVDKSIATIRERNVGRKSQAKL